MPDTSRAVTPPPATPDAAASYRPVSGLAIAALAVSVLAAVIISIVGIVAKVKGKAVLSQPLLLLAGLGLVLAFLARWQIRRSEGTRVGLGLANAAWWLSLLFGAGYGAFLAATELAVRNQAQTAADKWFSLLKDGKPELAFRLARDPGQQRSIAEDPEAIRRRFGNADLPAFLNSEMIRAFRNWPGKTEVRYMGVHNWDVTPTGYKVGMNYIVHNPEGNYDMLVTAQGHDDPVTGARDWQVGSTDTMIRGRQYTELGIMMIELQAEAMRRAIPNWIGTLTEKKVDITPLVRVEGRVPTEDQKTALKQQLTNPGAISLPSGGPMAPPPRPTVSVGDDGVRLALRVEVNTQALGNGVHGTLTFKVVGDELVKELIRLQGPGWEQQPIVPPGEHESQLLKYTYDLQPAELNIQPSAPRRAPGDAPGGPG